jgi:FkbM family methyltransferase
VGYESFKLQLKGGVRRALAAADLEIHRSSSSWRRSLPPILEHYKRLGLAPATLIDVGVGPGTAELYAGLRDAHLLLVEPLEEWRGHMEAISTARATDIVLAAAGAKGGETRISVHPVLWNSSVLGTPRGEDTEQEWRTIPVVRLDNVVRDLALAGPYVLKIDVEGGELDVLAGATDLLAETDLVLLELSLFELVPGSAQFHEVVAWMHDHGFVLSEFYDGHNRLLDGSLAKIDGAFVREDGRFRQSHAYATADQARQLYAGIRWEDHGPNADAHR